MCVIKCAFKLKYKMINKRGIVEVMAALLVHVYPLSVHLVPPMTVCSVTIGSRGY